MPAKRATYYDKVGEGRRGYFYHFNISVTDGTSTEQTVHVTEGVVFVRRFGGESGDL